MIIDRRRLILAALASVILLGILFTVGNFRIPDLSRAKPAWLIVIITSHLCMITGRGLAFRALAATDQRTGGTRWIGLAARHQLLFSVVPAGAGDVGFPYLAKRFAGIESHQALRIIAQFRVRDAIVVALMGLAGLTLLGFPGRHTALAFVLAIPVLWFSDDIAVACLRLARRVAVHGALVDFLEKAADHERPTPFDRLIRTALACLIWSASVVAVTAAFRTIGMRVGIAEALVFIAAVNLAGAFSFSVAGLGVSEAGAAAALVAAGMPVHDASSVALIVRPLLLLSIVCAGILIALVTAGSHRRLWGASTP